jgi:hypothetical protein
MNRCENTGRIKHMIPEMSQIWKKFQKVKIIDMKSVERGNLGRSSMAIHI